MKDPFKSTAAPLKYIRFQGEQGLEIILRRDLPEPHKLHWTPRTRRLFTQAVNEGLLTKDEFETKYKVTFEDIEAASKVPQIPNEIPASKVRYEGVVLPTTGVLSEGVFELDIEHKTLRVDGQLVPLDRREFIIMTLFMFRSGEIILREQLLGTLQDRGLSPSLGVLDTYVSALRSKFYKKKAYLEVFSGEGYTFKKP